MFKSTYRLAAAALAVMAIGGAPAVASAVPTDLRSPDARGAAHEVRTPVDAPGATAVDSATRPAPPAVPNLPTWPADPQPVTPAAQPATAGDSGGIDWETIGLGVAGSLVAVGAMALVAGRSRRRARPVRVGA